MVKNNVKMMEKAECVFMMPQAYGDSYVPETVVKNLWKCLSCGYVWSTRQDAQNCDHSGSYVRIYGGYFENGMHKGGNQFRIKAVRKESPECVKDCLECKRFGLCVPQK